MVCVCVGGGLTTPTKATTSDAEWLTDLVDGELDGVERDLSYQLLPSADEQSPDALTSEDGLKSLQGVSVLLSNLKRRPHRTTRRRKSRSRFKPVRCVCVAVVSPHAAGKPKIRV